tara:strand:+ start:1096 stop:1284 length:189 start_codon:yes stop_codon:yes gene_type:complete
MNPTETLNVMMEVPGIVIVDETSDHANNLANWLNRSGCPPALRVSTPERTGTGFMVTNQMTR